MHPTCHDAGFWPPYHIVRHLTHDMKDRVNKKNPKKLHKSHFHPTCKIWGHFVNLGHSWLHTKLGFVIPLQKLAIILIFYLNIFSLFSAFTSLYSKWWITVDGVGRFNPDLCIFMNLMCRCSSWNWRPWCRNQDVNILEMSPAMTGCIQRFTALK